MRLLIWLALGVIVFFAMRNAAKAEFEAQASLQKQASAPPENMVACDYCHIYLPASEAVMVVKPSLKQFFCSEEHLRLHAGGAAATPAGQQQPNE
jgi:hypothetical protein